MAAMSAVPLSLSSSEKPSVWNSPPLDIVFSIVEHADLRTMGSLLLTNKVFSAAIQSAPNYLLKKFAVEEYGELAIKVLDLWRPNGLTPLQREKLKDYTKALGKHQFGGVDRTLGIAPGTFGFAELIRCQKDRRNLFGVFYQYFHGSSADWNTDKQHEAWRLLRQLNTTGQTSERKTISYMNSNINVLYAQLFLMTALHSNPARTGHGPVSEAYFVDLSVYTKIPFHLHSLRVSLANAFTKKVTDEPLLMDFAKIGRDFGELFQMFVAPWDIAKEARFERGNLLLIARDYEGRYKVYEKELLVDVCKYDPDGRLSAAFERRTIWIRKREHKDLIAKEMDPVAACMYSAGGMADSIRRLDELSTEFNKSIDVGFADL